jgi:hypothetical protein
METSVEKWETTDSGVDGQVDGSRGVVDARGVVGEEMEGNRERLHYFCMGFLK